MKNSISFIVFNIIILFYSLKGMDHYMTIKVVMVTIVDENKGGGDDVWLEHTHNFLNIIWEWKGHLLKLAKG